MLKLCAVTCVVLVVTVDGGYYSHHKRGRHPPASEECPEPTVYLQQGSFNGSEEFYAAFDQSLQDEQCDVISSYGQKFSCFRYSFDETYNDILNYLRTACKFDYSKSSYLTTLLETYCDYHCPDTDDSVAEAYNCSTGCGLADHLNQFCNDRAAALETEAVCTDGYVKFSGTGTCYKYFSDDDDFFFAMMSCEQMGGQLVQIDSEEENQFVFELIMNNTGSARVWIGLNDVLDEGNFTWATSYDTPIYFNWGPNQPNNNVPNEADCVVINFNDVGNDNSDDAKWNDVINCASRHQPYVCERQPTA